MIVRSAYNRKSCAARRVVVFSYSLNIKLLYLSLEEFYFVGAKYVIVKALKPVFPASGWTGAFVATLVPICVQFADCVLDQLGGQA
jgi:hypothetical protein